MNSYDALAASYDALTADAEHLRRARYLERLFRKSAIPVETVLGPGLRYRHHRLPAGRARIPRSRRGRLEEMLTQAAKKADPLGERAPLFLHQSMPRLRLGREVDAAISTLDSLNYLTRTADLRETLRRVCRWLKHGGMFFFDVNTPGSSAGWMVRCTWTRRRTASASGGPSSPSGRRSAPTRVDLFQADGQGAWDRAFEEHRERAWDREELEEYLHEAGFDAVTVTGDLTSRPPRPDEDRWIFRCRKPRG